MIKVLVVDDSPFMRQELTKILESDPEIQVVGTARGGLDCLNKVKELGPDVVALEIRIPKLDGLKTLQKIMAEKPTPVVVISSLTRKGTRDSFEAVDLGAVDFVAKPSGDTSLDIDRQKDEIIRKIKGARHAKLGRLGPAEKTGKKNDFPGFSPSHGPKPASLSPVRRSPRPGHLKAVVIGVSTGGPKTLLEVLPKIGFIPPVPLFIAQHMPKGFTASFAKRLNDCCPFPVKEVENNETVQDGVAYLAAGGSHLMLTRQDPDRVVAKLTQPQGDPMYTPSVDLLFNSAVEVYQGNVLGVLLTGMGHDGVMGMENIKRHGGTTIAEDESTCIIFGMPKEAIEKGVADFVLPSNKIAEKIVELIL